MTMRTIPRFFFSRRSSTAARGGLPPAFFLGLALFGLGACAQQQRARASDEATSAKSGAASGQSAPIGSGDGPPARLRGRRS